MTVFFRTLVCYLVPGLLLGFGLAVFPRRELLGRRLPPHRRWLLQVLPERALTVGWLLLAGTLLLRWGGTGTTWELLVGRCILLDAMTLGGMGVWTARDLRTLTKNPPCKVQSLSEIRFGKIYKNIL